jgi:hypothetical protein
MYSKESMDKKRTEYYDKLQTYIDKVKELKEWMHSTKDNETKGYLRLEIDKQLTDMKVLISENAKKK